MGNKMVQLLTWMWLICQVGVTIVLHGVDGLESLSLYKLFIVLKRLWFIEAALSLVLSESTVVLSM